MNEKSPIFFNRASLATFCFIALLLFVVYQVLRIFSPFINSIFWATILTFAFYPIYARLKPLFGKKEVLAALSMTFLIVCVVIPPLVVIIGNIATQAVELYQLATDYITGGHLEQVIDKAKTLPIMDKVRANTYLEWEQIKENITNMVLSSSKTITNFSISQAGVITKNLFILSINVVMIAFLTFIFLKDGQKIYEFIYNATPLEEENKKEVFEQINGTFAAVIRGQLLTSLTQAAVTGAIFWGLGLPLPIFFAVATFFLTALVPFIGAAGVWLPYTIFLVVQQSYIKAAILGAVGLLVISLIDNVMKPAVIGEKTKLPYFLLFFGILGGLKVYGIMGVFLAPAILSLFFALIKIYQQKFTS